MFQRSLVIVLVSVFMFGCSVPKKTIGQEAVNDSDHLSRGVAYERRGEWPLALQEYALASQKDPRGNFYMGNLLFQQNRLDEAEGEYRKALQAMRTNADLLNNLAWLLYTRQSDLAEAEELARLAVHMGTPERADEYEDTLEQIRQLRRQPPPSDAPFPDDIDESDSIRTSML